MNPRTDFLPLSLLVAIVIGLVPSALAYRYALPLLTPANVSGRATFPSKTPSPKSTGIGRG
jgi:hypothetical protein